MPKQYDPNEMNFGGTDGKTAIRKSIQHCSSCFIRASMSAFSSGNCQICGDEIICASTPCMKLCWKCARQNNKCIACGGDMD